MFIPVDSRQQQLVVVRHLPEVNHVDPLKLSQDADEGGQGRFDKRLAVVFERGGIHADVEGALCDVRWGSLRNVLGRRGVRVCIATRVEVLD